MRIRPATAVWIYAAVVAVLLGYFMLDIPVQLNDSLQNILGVRRRTMWDLVLNQFWSAGYLRPLLFAPIKLVFEASGGHYTAWFRGFHVAQMAFTIGLFVALLRVRTWTDAAAAPLALAACVGLHTFAGTIREAFPINGYLTVIDCCLAAALVAAARPRWWSVPCAVGLLILAALTVESGLLVWVVLIAGFIAGWRGVPRWGVVLATLCVVAYFVTRFAALNTSMPGLSERSTGFGLQILEPAQIIERFGDNPWPLYAYNVGASVGSVLFAEPRAGVFWVVRDVLSRDVEPWTIVNLVACASLTAFIIWFVASGTERWRRWELGHNDQLVAVFVAVLGANAVMNYVYTKDVIMSPAGVFFALAGYAAIRECVGRLEHVSFGALGARRAASVCLLICATAWGIKAAGVHFSLRHIARDVRMEWAFVDEWQVKQEITITDPRDRAIVEVLRADALWRRPALPRIDIPWPWPGEWFDTSQ
ncbi:MAG: hypothetical protein ABL993_01150 [Vicinamibacterales bacterium]